MCALVQKSGIGALAEGMLLVHDFHLWCGFDGLQPGVESLVCAYKVTLSYQSTCARDK